MKVLLASTVKLDTNGISRFIINTARVLKNEGIDVEISSPEKANNEIKKNLNDLKIKLVEFNNRKRHPLKYVINFKKYINQNKIDIIHVNGSSTIMALELLAAKLAGAKVRIAHSHNTTTEHPVINKMLRPLFNFSVNGRIACNEAAGKWLFKSRKFIVIPNGINLMQYKFNTSKREKIRSKLGIKDNEILLGHVGEFNYQKNQVFLIDLLKKLPSKYKLILIGKGKDLINVKTKAIQNQLSKRTIFTGTIDNVQDYLSAIDIFVLPSRFEGQPFVLVEATASGLNCVVSNEVSCENDIANNVNFVSLKDVAQWKYTIEQYLKFNREDKSLNNISILTEQGYNAHKNIDKLIDYYKGYQK